MISEGVNLDQTITKIWTLANNQTEISRWITVEYMLNGLSVYFAGYNENLFEEVKFLIFIARERYQMALLWESGLKAKTNKTHAQ